MCRAPIFLFTLFVVAPSWARAEEPTPETTEARLERLERELAELKARPAPPPTTAPQAAAAPTGPIANVSEGTTKTGTRASLTLSGYAEMFYQWNFNNPSNGITNFRGFDNRHNSFTISNAVIDAMGTLGPIRGHSVSAHVALQIGHTPETYYLAEPISVGAAGAGSTGPPVWKFIQQANMSYRAPLGRGLLIEGGIFLSPIGPEGMAVKDQWNWSRSNLFFGLPFYHTGVRISYGFTDRINVSLAAYNGWNSVVDNNAQKSIAAQLTYSITDKLTYQVLYFTGVERPTGAPEGKPWRHLFDSYLAWYPLKWLSLLGHADAGFEPNAFGTSWWAAGALYARFQPLPWLYLAMRGDFFREGVAANTVGSASPIFWPAEWVASGTGTVEVRPIDNVSFRVEYRHDHAQAPMYFRDQVANDLLGAPIANATSQNTVTVGMTAWF